MDRFDDLIQHNIISYLPQRLLLNKYIRSLYVPRDAHREEVSRVGVKVKELKALLLKKKEEYEKRFIVPEEYDDFNSMKSLFKNDNMMQMENELNELRQNIRRWDCHYTRLRGRILQRKY